MTELVELFPTFGVRIALGPLELRGLTDEDLPGLCDLAVAGIHPPERMPFSVPWTDAPPAELARNIARYHWQARADFSADAWVLHLGVWYAEELVGTQALETHDYLVTRTGETGSWLGSRHQGRGIGTAMRQLICAFAFDHLDAAEVTSAAFLDNPASIAVSRKIGYRDNGVVRLRRREGELAENLRLVLTPDAFVRPHGPVEVQGAEVFRRAIGLEPFRPPRR